MVYTSLTISRLTITWLTIFWLWGIGVVANGGASLSAWSISTNSTNTPNSFHIPVGSLISPPKWSSTRARSVVIGWRWAVFLLLLVVSHHQDLPDCSDEKEKGGNDGNCKDSSIESAGKVEVGGIRCGFAISEAEAVGAIAWAVAIGWAVAKGCLDIASTAACAVSGHDRDSNECTNEENVEDGSEETEESVAAEAKNEDDAEYCVECCCACQTLDCLPFCRDRKVFVCEDCKEV